jgi:hypothetical protein
MANSNNPPDIWAIAAAVFVTGTAAAFNVTISNAGNIHLQGVNLGLAAALADSLVCDKPPTSAAAIPVKTSVHCSGTFVLTLDDIEAGSYTLSANVTAANLAAMITAAPVTITAVPVPQLEIDVVGSNCTKPPRARKRPVYGCSIAFALDHLQ